MSDVTFENGSGVPVEGVVATQAVEPAAKKNKKPVKGDTDLKDYNNAAAKRSRDKKKEKQKRKDGRFNSATVITKKEAIEILEKERLIRNPHVVETCVALAEVAARHFKIPFNAHLMTHG